MQVDADSSVLRSKLGEMLNTVLGRQAHRAELAAWFSVSTPSYWASCTCFYKAASLALNADVHRR